VGIGAAVRIVFLGTPAFAVPTLERLVAAGHEVAAVVTQPDRPRGRGHEAAAPPVKQAALRLGLPVYQPERIRRPEALEYLAALTPRAMVVVGYGQIVPQSIIDLAPLGILNVHASLLPKYRGAAPIQWAIVNGDDRTGVTIMRIDAGLDTGDMLLKTETEIGPEENAVELGQRLSTIGAGLLIEALAAFDAGSIVPEKQDSAQATYAPLLKKEDGRIDWRHPARAIHNRVRGLQPWPGASTAFRGHALQIWRSRPIEFAGNLSATPGALASVRPLVAGTGDGGLELLEVQLEGRKRMPAADFANGHRLAENERLGELPA
jgi:methionyl-tRNA formyltransferase